MITREQTLGARIGILLGLLIGLIMLLSGCVSATYNATEGSEEFKLRSFLKSVDGLETKRTEGTFDLKIDKTHTQDPMGNMLEMLKMMERLRYSVPPDQDQGD